MKQNITKQLTDLRNSFGEPIAVALIVDHNGISIRKARKLGPHLIASHKDKTKSMKASEFDEGEIDDVNFEAIPGFNDGKKDDLKTKYIG
ncbi:hypothetical protein CO037_02650 [Candidatus Pacearchaeota archaeon CG_4_9_14_0_2_um_filter_30_8]|nr:MAG: hypothetical protein CO037_02650 [Candidatus Pacearchaeota archaeon CG_4_9_14_0_2_um_filter_30_8]